MKLEIKHLAPYLPYGLKCLDMKDVDTNEFNPEYIKNENSYEMTMANISFTLTREYRFPILRPISEEELTKMLSTNMGDCIALDYISTSKKDREINAKLLLFGNSDSLEGWKLERLLQFHFDIFGLIPEGLAIDINSL